MWRLVFLALMLSPAHARDTTFDHLEGQLFPKLQAAGCPLDRGLSILDPRDKSTWTVLFGPSATDAQRAACRQGIDDFVFVPPVR